ncbi:sulfatase [bacterium]|nr:sulfatase [bacterium]
MPPSTRREFLQATALAGPAALAVQAHAAPASPNLLFVLVDQMRGQALGFLGEDPVLTPNLDRFAAQGIALPQAVSNYPVCSPYRGMWMTGKYPHANKVLSNCTSKTAPYDCELQEGDRCWSDVLHDKGYSLGYIGKWHLDAPRKPFVESYNNRPAFAWNEWCAPHRRHGFGFWYAYGTFDQHLTPEYWSTDMTRDQRVKVKQWGPEHEADLAIRYIRNEGGATRRADRPFALVVSMNPPHTPYNQVPTRYVEQYGEKTWKDLINRANVPVDTDSRAVRGAKSQIKNYFAMVTGVDDQFGRIVRALDDGGMGRNTIVVFTSDHGNCIGSHNVPTKNVYYEESMRVPFLVRWTGALKPRRDDLLLSTPDIYPTLLDLMGFRADIPPSVQGASHAQLLRTGAGPRPTSQLYMICPPGQPAAGRRGVRTRRYTLVISRMPKQPEQTTLHDNLADPFQLENIAPKHPDVVKALTQNELIPWLTKTKDPWLNAE